MQMQGWEAQLNSIIRTTEKNLVDFQAHSHPNPIAYQVPVFDKENLVPSPLVPYTCHSRIPEVGGSSATADSSSELRSLIQRIDAKLSADIQRTATDAQRSVRAVWLHTVSLKLFLCYCLWVCPRYCSDSAICVALQVDGLREEFRTHIGGTSQALSTDLWESTERRLLLLSEKIHAVESRSINGLGASATLLPNPVYAAPDPYASGVGSDVRVAQLERTVAELHNILRGVEKNAAPDQSLAVRLDRLEAKLASHTVGATAQMSAMEQVAMHNNGDGGAGAEVVAQLQGQIISIQRELEDDSVLNQVLL